MKEGFTGLVLAGGASSRMGFDKALARLGDETLLDRAIRLLSPLCATVMVVARSLDTWPVPGGRLVDTERPGAGPLGALAAGLAACPTPYAIVLACDLPLFPPGLAAYMQQVCWREPCWQALVPRWGRFWEPLAAVYARTCLPAITEALERGERRLTSFYPDVTLRAVTEEEIRRFAPPERAFFNVNRPSDLATAAKLLGRPGESGLFASAAGPTPAPYHRGNGAPGRWPRG